METFTSFYRILKILILEINHNKHIINNYKKLKIFFLAEIWFIYFFFHSLTIKY